MVIGVRFNGAGGSLLIVGAVSWARSASSCTSVADCYAATVTDLNSLLADELVVERARF